MTFSGLLLWLIGTVLLTVDFLVGHFVDSFYGSAEAIIILIVASVIFFIGGIINIISFEKNKEDK